MCIVILQSVGQKLFTSTLEHSFKRNADMAGVAAVNPAGKMVVEKGLDTLKKFIDTYERVQDTYRTSPILIHCRFATKGRVSKDNSHPFFVKDGVMAHNGTFWNGGDRDDMKSDTREVAEHCFNLMTKENIDKNKRAIEEAVTGRNKMVFLFNDKSYAIINERYGEWKDGCWFSNNGWH